MAPWTRRDPNRSSVQPEMWELRSANCAMVPSFAEHVLDVADGRLKQRMLKASYCPTALRIYPRT